MTTASIRRLIRRARMAALVTSERARAQGLRVLNPGVHVSRQARLARGAQVLIGEGGRLEIGPCAIGRNTVVQVAPGATVRLLGDYIGPNCVVVGRQSITVEEGVMIAEMCVLRDSDHDRNTDGRVSAEHVSLPVRIGRNAWLASRVTILKGVTVGSGATVAAGAVVTRDVAAGVTVGGVPARRLTSGHQA